MKISKNIFKLLIVISCVLLFQACPEEGYFFLYFENNSTISDDSLAVYVADGHYTAYPDTLLPDTFKNGMLKGVSIIHNSVGSTGIEGVYKQLPKDTLSVFILDLRFDYGTRVDSLWKEMNYGKRFLRRYDMSIQDVKLLNYSIPYPPNERMKEMKMYPPYGTE
jgi:hypothetical protein